MEKLEKRRCHLHWMKFETEFKWDCINCSIDFPNIER